SALPALSQAFGVFGFILIGCGVLWGVFVILFAFSQPMSDDPNNYAIQTAVSFVIATVPLVFSGLLAISIGESIRCFIGIEANSRRTNELLDQLVKHRS